MPSRAVARNLLRLLQEGNAPAAVIRHGRGGASTPASRILVRSMANGSIPPGTACCSCDRQILELRKEMLAETQRIWRMYEGLLDVNHAMLKKMCEIEAKAAERQIAAVEAMVKTSYRIIGSGGAFMFGMFMILSPLLKAAWQQDTIEAMEKKTRLERVDTVIEVKSAGGPTGAARNQEKGAMGSLLAVQVTEGNGRVVDGPAGAAKNEGKEVKGSLPGKGPVPHAADERKGDWKATSAQEKDSMGSLPGKIADGPSASDGSGNAGNK